MDMALKANSYKAISILVIALLVSTGCASKSASKTAKLSVPSISVDPPDKWHATAVGVVANGSPDLSRWWEQLSDATLTDLINRALKSNPDLGTAQARLRQSRADWNAAKAGLLPSLGASAAATGKQIGSSSFSPGFDASWEPDIYGATRKGIAAANADLQATDDDLRNTQVSLAAEVARNYIELRTLQARMNIAERSESIQEETLELTGFRSQAGLVSSVDVEQARTNLEQTRAQIPVLDSSISQAMHRISVLIGVEPGALTAQLTKPAPVPAAPEQIAISIPAETLRQRPDIRAAEEKIVAETARSAQAATRRYPTFSLAGNLGTNLVQGALSGGTSILASLAANTFATIFDGGRIREQIAAQNAVQEQAVSSYESKILTALEEVENALVAFENNRQRLDSLNQAASAADNAFELARNQYSAGLIDFQRVLDTQRTALTVQDNIATTQGDRLTALVQLYKALGGGWTPENNVSTGKNTA
jgi:outer membrane protein, multidrug efflux system